MPAVGDGLSVKADFFTGNIFVNSEDIFVINENNSEIIKNIFVRTVRNYISDRPKPTFGRFKKDFGRSETKLFSLITKLFSMITDVFSGIVRKIIMNQTALIDFKSVFLNKKCTDFVCRRRI